MRELRPASEAAQLADLAGLAVAAAVALPSAILRNGPNVCLVRRVTGLPCPACGITRSWNAAARLQVRDSLGFHPLGPPTLAIALAVAAAPVDDSAGPPWTRSRPFLAALGTAWIGVWVARLALAVRRQPARSILARPR
ncbi:MAG TPA: DUF2752 domain-containing protein [Clostridia bacterium]|nr:DUF2752 domain-containing protein [Clostridia bacterium]